MREPDYTLGQFEAWCKGEGRGGKDAGWHSTALAAAKRFRDLKLRLESKQSASEKLRHVEAD